MNILYLGSHAILEYDQTKLWTALGHDVFSIGAYTNPQQPAVPLRPAIAEATHHADLEALCHAQRVLHAADDVGYPIIDWAKADLHPQLVEWADTVIVDCYPESWIPRNWPKFSGKRVIWRTIGQSGPATENIMRTFRAQGLEIVRYSPAEARAYGDYPWFAGEDAMIRFGKDPADWYGWTGEREVIGNLAQHDATPHARGQFLHWGWIEEATKGLPFEFGGPNSQNIGGLGELTYDEMRTWLRGIRAYVYTGTIPASYTLALIEAMMTGCPVVGISQLEFGTGDLYEGHELTTPLGGGPADWAHEWLADFLTTQGLAAKVGQEQREHTIELFGIETIGAQWADFLGTMSATQVERRLAGVAA